MTFTDICAAVEYCEAQGWDSFHVEWVDEEQVYIVEELKENG